MIERLEKNRVFQGLIENEVCFLPTFKLNKGRDLYDTSPKKRAPAWTDRILFKPCEGKVRCEKYESVGGARHSDHRPVVGVFTVHLEEEEEAVKEGGKKEGGKEEEVPMYGEEEESEASEAEEEEEEETMQEEEEEEEEFDDDSGYESDDEEEEDDDDSDF